jgi:hypothetical protein
MGLRRSSLTGPLLAAVALGLLRCSAAPSRSSDAKQGGAPEGASSGGGTSLTAGCSGRKSIALDRLPVGHRQFAVACGTSPMPPQSQADGGDAGGPACATDADCTDSGLPYCANGRCASASSVGSSGGAGSYCFTDSDCPPNWVCECNVAIWQGINECVQGNCRVDSDCAAVAGPGGMPSCSQGAGSGHSLCQGTGGYYCHTPRDECLDESDCTGCGVDTFCVFDATVAHFVCCAG